MKRKLKQ